jgi:hypothetical protein
MILGGRLADKSRGRRNVGGPCEARTSVSGDDLRGASSSASPQAGDRAVLRACMARVDAALCRSPPAYRTPRGLRHTVSGPPSRRPCSTVAACGRSRRSIRPAGLRCLTRSRSSGDTTAHRCAARRARARGIVPGCHHGEGRGAARVGLGCTGGRHAPAHQHALRGLILSP